MQALLFLFLLTSVMAAPLDVAVPMCGNKDTQAQERHKRFVLEGAHWRRRSLTYNIYKYPTNPRTLKQISRKEIDKIISQAFSTWSSVAAIDFERMDKDSADIQIGWETGDHGDDNPFDGVCTGCLFNIVAHGFYPNKGGDIHFDDADTFGRKNVKHSNTTDYNIDDLFETATHEIGHVLGLKHSKVKEAFMWPYTHMEWQTKHSLHQDDVDGVVELYGARENPYKGKMHQDVCDVTGFDAAYSTNLGSF